MKFAVKGFAVLAVAGLTACAQPSRPPVVQDTGNMAYPTPLPQGNISTTRPGAMAPGVDTGSSRYPAPIQQGNVGTTSPRRLPPSSDTGTMAIPENSMGNLRRTTP